MIYKNFDENITRKHGIVIEGWPLRTFDNPSAIGSQVELKVLLNAWQSGATRFRKMSTEEHMEWVVARADSQPSPTHSANPTPTPLVLPPAHNNDPDLITNPSPLHTPFIHFESPTAPPVSTNTTPGANPTPSGAKKPRKIRSDKGKPRKKTTQTPGANVFSASMS